MSTSNNAFTDAKHREEKARQFCKELYATETVVYMDEDGNIIQRSPDGSTTIIKQATIYPHEPR